MHVCVIFFLFIKNIGQPLNIKGKSSAQPGDTEHGLPYKDKWILFISHPYPLSQSRIHLHMFLSCQDFSATLYLKLSSGGCFALKARELTNKEKS